METGIENQRSGGRVKSCSGSKDRSTYFWKATDVSIEKSLLKGKGGDAAAS